MLQPKPLINYYKTYFLAFITLFHKIITADKLLGIIYYSETQEKHFKCSSVIALVRINPIQERYSQKIKYN